MRYLSKNKKEKLTHNYMQETSPSVCRNLKAKWAGLHLNLIYFMELFTCSSSFITSWEM